MWTPTHIVVTVLRARNLLEKGKNGNDAYCMIGMGKEKYLTSVKMKSLSPVWDEQAEFALGERADLKINVYHKSSIIDEFVGRVVISLNDLYNENYKSFTKWYKLTGKPDKVENSKKPDKERGEIEIRTEFVIKPKAGSMMDLSVKSRESSLSLRNLKEKSFNIKDKFKLLNKSKKSKFTGENQLAEQARKMGGSKLDFLDGEDIGSIASSYSSINGPTLNRDLKVNTMSRFNPARSSFISKSSSRNDSFSFNGGETPFDEDELNEKDDDKNMAAPSPFKRQNSIKFSRQSLRSNGSYSQRQLTNNNFIDENSNTSLNGIDEEKIPPPSSTNEAIHIAPLPPFGDDDEPNNFNSNNQILNAINNDISNQKFDDDFTASFNEINNPKRTSFSFESNQPKIISNLNDKQLKMPSEDQKSSNSTESQQLSNNSSSVSSYEANFERDDRTKLRNSNSNLDIKNIEIIPSRILNHSNKPQAPVIPAITTTTPSQTTNTSNLSNSIQDDEDDHIDWASSEDEEIVKQEVETFETFERNQLFRQSERKKVLPTQDLVSDLLNSSDPFGNNQMKTIDLNEENNNYNNNNNNDDYKKITSKLQDWDTDLKTPDFEKNYFFDSQDSSKLKKDSNNNENSTKNNDLPDLINQNGSNDNSSDKARKYLEGIDGVKFNEVLVPDTLKKQLEYFDRDELLQLIAYQKKYLDYKESRIKDLENYIDNLVVKIIETEPLILMNASNVLNKSRNLI